MWQVLASCAEVEVAPPAPGPSESRAIGERPPWAWRATLRSWTVDGAARTYVGWELSGRPGASVRGEVDQVEAWDDAAGARAAYDALRLDTCADGDAVGFRIGRDPRVRVIVPDEAGAAVALTPLSSCPDALAWVGPADEWRRDRSAGGRICEHLYRLGHKGDAIRCLLREPLRPAPPVASRQELPTAPDDPRFDGELLGVLAPDAPGDRTGFTPYRVAQLLSEVRDRDAVRRLADALAAAPERSPWRAAVLATVDHPALAAWIDEVGPRTDDAAAAIVEIGLTSLLRTDPAAARARAPTSGPPRLTCRSPDRPAPGRCPDPTLPE